ncbi:tetratricopeptide repeat protein [Actinophytocola sp. KF-1]
MSVLYQLGDHDGARALGADTLARRRRSLGPAHPETTFLADFLAALPDR